MNHEGLLLGGGALGRLYSYITSSRGRERWGREGEREGERGGEREREGGGKGPRRVTGGTLRAICRPMVVMVLQEDVTHLLPLRPVSCRMKNLWSET